MFEKMKTKKITKEHLISLVMLVLLFIYMYALNFMMPLHRDDYEYSLIWGTYERIVAWPDIFQSLYIHYLTHGGRMVDFFVLDSFILLGKQWFNPFNAFLFIALIVLIYWHSQRNITFRFNPYILALIILFCWLGLPDFALVNIWMTGACVYLMSAVLIFTFLLPYHFNFLEKPLLSDRYMAAFGMFFCGVVAGWTIENTAATMNFIIAGFIFYAYKKHSLTIWMLSGFCGSVLGFLLLVIAPGNYVRYADSSPKIIYHFSNQLVAGFEILLGVLPVILFFVLVWRILLTEHAREKGVYVIGQQGNSYGFGISSMLIVAGILFILLSYPNSSFISKWLGSLIYDNVAVPLGVANSHLKVQLSNTMAGLEEVVVYLLTITQIYRYIFKKLVLRKNDIRDIMIRVKWQEIMVAYPACYYAAALIVLSVINNLVMIASPTFPGRAGFGSVVFLIIGAVSLFTIPQVYVYLLGSSRKKYLTLFAGLLFIPMAVAVLHQHIVLYKENNQRMIYVEKMVSQGATYLELEPLSLKNLVLRHVYFVELNNEVSKYGFNRYYRLKDLKVKE
jgi:hypothetical protein